MRDAVLAIVGTIGIAALVMSMNKDKNQVREDFNGFSLRNRLDKTVKNNKIDQSIMYLQLKKNMSIQIIKVKQVKMKIKDYPKIFNNSYKV